MPKILSGLTALSVEILIILIFFFEYKIEFSIKFNVSKILFFTPCKGFSSKNLDVYRLLHGR